MHWGDIMLRTWLLAVAATAFVSFPACAETASPAWGSDKIRAARSLAASPALVFWYEETLHSPQGSKQSDFGTVTLAGDFNVVQTVNLFEIDDFALCRDIEWEEGTTEVSHFSCYAVPAFRQAEPANRRGLAAMLTAAAPQAEPQKNLTPYWAEQELAMQETPSRPLTERRTGDGVQWLLQDQVVVQVSAAGTPFTADERQRVARYFARHVDLHPQVLEAILDSGQLPERLVIERKSGGKPETKTLLFTQVRRTSAAYPLPPGLTSSLTIASGGQSLEAKGMRQALAAIAGTATPPKPSLTTLTANIQASADAGNMRQGAMWFYALTQQYGGDLKPGTPEMAELKKVIPTLQSIMNSPDVLPFRQASDVAGGNDTSQTPEAAARYLAKATEYDSLSFGTFRHVTFANLVQGAGDTGKWDKSILAAMPSLTDCYWLHIAAYPWAANAYKDLGDTYYRSFDTVGAWNAWDLGRAVDPDWQKGVMSNVAEYEQRLRTDAANNF